MENLLKQINDSSTIYELVNSTLDDIRKDMVYKHPEVMRKYSNPKE